jgi:hypothetical protein
MTHSCVVYWIKCAENLQREVERKFCEGGPWRDYFIRNIYQKNIENHVKMFTPVEKAEGRIEYLCLINMYTWFV